MKGSCPQSSVPSSLSMSLEPALGLALHQYELWLLQVTPLVLSVYL